MLASMPSAWGARVNRSRGGRRLGPDFLATLVLIGALASSGALGAGCRPTRPAEREGGTLVMVVPATVGGEIDPHMARVAHPVLTALYDTLLTQDAAGVMRSGLATAWSASDDGREIVLTLREGVRFADGSPLDGEAVVRNLERVVAAGPGAMPVAQLLGPLREARAQGLRVTLSYDRPFPPVWSALIDPRLGMLSPATLEAYQGGEEVLPTGSGPYRFASVDDQVPGVWLLERNSTYAWPPAPVSNPGAPYPEFLRVELWPDGDPANGEHEPASPPPPTASLTADIVWWPAGEPLPEQLAHLDGEWRDHSFGGTRVTYMVPVLVEEPFVDVSVRRALALALDRTAAAGSMPWSAAPAGSLLAGWPGLDPGTPAPLPDLEAAAGLLSAAGWTMDPDGVRRRDGQELAVRLATYEDDPSFAALAQEVLEQLAGLGFSGRQVPPRRGLTPGSVAGAPNLWLLYYDWPDPDVLYYLFHSSETGRGNRSALRDLEVDGMLETSRSTASPALRIEQFRQLDAVVLQHAAAVPLARSSGRLRLGGRVAGWRAQRPGALLPHDIYLREGPAR